MHDRTDAQVGFEAKRSYGDQIFTKFSLVLEYRFKFLQSTVHISYTAAFDRTASLVNH